jgi:transposase
MMGRREGGQGQFFYSFKLDEVVPADHLVRQIDGVLDLDWVHKELAPYYSHTGRPSIDPVLMIRMLIVGYVFAIRSERRLCAEVQVNLAYRWFCKLGIEDKIPDHSVFCRARHERSSRRLEREARHNVEVMWLSGRLVPDHRTIADFRKDNGTAIRKVRARFVTLCRAMGLLTQASVAIDGSKFKAVNNRDRNFTRAKMWRRMVQIEESVARYLQQLDTADRQEPSEALKTKTSGFKEKSEKLREQSQKRRLAYSILGPLGFPVERAYDTITIGHKL